MSCSRFSMKYWFDRFIVNLRGANLHLPSGTSLAWKPTEKAIILKPNCAGSPIKSIIFQCIWEIQAISYIQGPVSGNAPQATLLHLSFSSNQQCRGSLLTASSSRAKIASQPVRAVGKMAPVEEGIGKLSSIPFDLVRLRGDLAICGQCETVNGGLKEGQDGSLLPTTTTSFGA